MIPQYTRIDEAPASPVKACPPRRAALVPTTVDEAEAGSLAYPPVDLLRGHSSLRAKLAVAGAATLLVAASWSSRPGLWSNRAAAPAKRPLVETDRLWEQADIFEAYQTSCAHYGCDSPYDETHDCQCNDRCLEFHSCCKDYMKLCLSAEASTAEGEAPEEATVADSTQVAPAPPAASSVAVASADQVSQSASLYCFAVMMPFGYERGLLSSIYEQQAGIFTCEAYQIFSNETISVANGVDSYPLPGPLSVAYGGKWGLALNTDVFIRVWKGIQYLETYKDHDWSIKVDPDCVFFPGRFRTFVTRRSMDLVPGPLVPPGPVFLNNCKFGMHGPIEAVSREGMIVFLDRIDDCESIREAAMDIYPNGRPADLPASEHAFGEDQYLRRCLVHLNVRQINEFDSLLSEKFACVERPADCGGAKVAFHAFKTNADWQNCYDFATSSATSWPNVPEYVPPVVEATSTTQSTTTQPPTVLDTLSDRMQGAAQRISRIR